MFVSILGVAFAWLAAPQAETELIPGSSVLVPGGSVKIAMHMHMAKGWHSYYANPGESGQATSITWHLPASFSAGPILWPTPKRIDTAGVAGYVYEDDVWLVSEVHVPSTLSASSKVTLQADVKWLLCSDACYPQNSHLTLTLPVGTKTVWNPAFSPAQNQLPRSPVGLNLDVALRSKAATLTIQGKGLQGSNYQFFPADAASFGADPHKVVAHPGGAVITVPLSRYASTAPKRLTGILVVPEHGGLRSLWIDVKVGDL